MESILVIFSWAILLVSGFDDSVPPTGDKTFKIEYSDIVQSIKTISDEPLGFWGFEIELKQNSGGDLEIKIPKNFPIPASFTGTWNHDERPFVLGDNTEIAYEKIEEPCYFHYKIPVEGKKNVEISYTVILTGTWKLYSSIEFDDDDPCYNKVFYVPPIEPPLKQFKSGIDATEVKCKEGLMLVTKKIDNSPACVKPLTYNKLVERGWVNIQGSQMTFFVFANDTKYEIPYHVTGWKNKVLNMTADIEVKSLVVDLQTKNKGELTITLPRGLIDSKMDNANEIFFILVNGEEVSFKEEKTENSSTLTIGFPEGTSQIEIIVATLV
jgi:hypothetical protein